MILKSLSLLNYKNFDNKSFTFSDKINCIVGNNGIGKTNVLDAIYHLSFGKSYFNPVATQNIKHDEDFFVVHGDYEKDNKPEDEDHLNYYSEFCRLYLTNTILTAQLKELSIEKNELVGKLTRI